MSDMTAWDIADRYWIIAEQIRVASERSVQVVLPGETLQASAERHTASMFGLREMADWHDELAEHIFWEGS